MVMISPQFHGPSHEFDWSSHSQNNSHAGKKPKKDTTPRTSSRTVLIALLIIAIAVGLDLTMGLTAIIPSFFLGILAGILTAVVRLRAKSRIIDELIAAIIEPGTVSALQVRWSSAAEAVLIGLLSSVIAVYLGFTDVQAVDTTSFIGPLLSSVCWQTCGVGGGGAGAASIIAIAIILIIVVLLVSIGVATILAFLAKSVVTSGVHGGARSLGLAITLALTRLWTTRLTKLASRSPAGRLSLQSAVNSFIEEERGNAWRWYQDWMRRERGTATLAGFLTLKRDVVTAYLDWLKQKHKDITLEMFGNHPICYQKFSLRWIEHQRIERTAVHWPKYKRGTPEEIAQRPLRKARWHAQDDAKFEARLLEDLSKHVRQIAHDRDPVNRMVPTDDAPAFDGSVATLFHDHWLTSALQTGVRDGLVIGCVSGVLELILLGLHY